MSNKEVLLGGHSHINALVGDMHCEIPALRELGNGMHAKVLDGPWPRSVRYWKEFALEARDRNVGLMWGGNEHNSIYLFEGAWKVDFASRYVTRLLGRAQIVTQRTVKQRFRDLTLNEMDETLTLLCSSSPSKLALLGTPPPKKDNSKLREMLAHEPVFLAIAQAQKSTPKTIEFTDPYVRLKLWYLLQDMFREAASKFGAFFVPVPAETQDADGFLCEEFWAPDVTHANLDYGRLMLTKTLAGLKR